MNEENNNNQETQIPEAPQAAPSFALPKKDAPNVSFGQAATPSFATERPANFGSPAAVANDDEPIAMVAIDVIAVAMAVAGLALFFIG